uniref:Niban 1/2/3 domain-containing protein n=1 Tax=Ornithorhynchus anatinus TaxID=9258 RepID=F7EHV5_ORNAN
APTACSAPVQKEKQRRTVALARNFMPYYRRHLASVFLRKISRELDPQGQPGPQLMQRKVSVGFIGEGWLGAAGGTNPFPSGKGCEPRGSTALTGYTLVTSGRDYISLVVDSVCQGLGDPSQWGPDPITEPPMPFSIYLYHPFRQHFCFCMATAESQHSWKCALSEGIRHRSTVLQRRKSLDVEAFLDAVQFYRQEKGCYGVDDLLLGTEPEILTNLLMEDLLPVLQDQNLPPLQGLASRWTFLEEVYTLVLAQISDELQDFQKEKEELHRELEKKIRPDVGEMLALRNHIAQQLQRMVRGPADGCCCREVDPMLGGIGDKLLSPISTGMCMVRLIFTRRIDQLLRNLQNVHSVRVLKEEICSLSAMPWDSVLMRPCYKKAELYWSSLQGFKERFGFCGTTSLVLGAQDLMQQLLENSVYTFQQLSDRHLNSAINRSQVTQVLEKVKGRVLKKFDSDSSFAQKQFVEEWVIQIFSPFLLRSLETSCKLVSMKPRRHLLGINIIIRYKKIGHSACPTLASRSNWGLESPFLQKRKLRCREVT